MNVRIGTSRQQAERQLGSEPPDSPEERGASLPDPVRNMTLMLDQVGPTDGSNRASSNQRRPIFLASKQHPLIRLITTSVCE